MADQKWPVYGEITGPIVMIGFGSIGRGTLPLIERHFKFDKSRLIVIDPSDENRKLLDERLLDQPGNHARIGAAGGDGGRAARMLALLLA